MAKEAPHSVEEAVTPAAGATVSSAEVKFRPDLEALASKLETVAKTDPTTGVISIPAGVFFEHAPEGMTAETYERDRKYTDLFSNAATLVGVRKSVAFFKEKPEAQQATMHAPIFKKDAYEGVFKRNGTSRNVRTGEVSTYVGSVGVGRINVVSTRTQTEWHHIKQYMKDIAEAADL